jgi:hypothetical protein
MLNPFENTKRIQITFKYSDRTAKKLSRSPVDPTQHTVQCVPGFWFFSPGAPPSNAEVKKRQELYLLPSGAPSWRVAGPFYFTAKKTRRISGTKINWLLLFKEITSVYSDNHTKSIHTLYG